MKVRYTIDFRRFSEADERNDSGYYNGLSAQKRAVIDVNRNDDTFEQTMTVYHEITHALLDLLCNYKLDAKHKTPAKQDPSLKADWNAFDAGGVKEEALCRAVEIAVKKVFKKQIPTPFYKKFFEQGKRHVRNKKRSRRPHKQRK